jgi:hypothetical protein
VIVLRLIAAIPSLILAAATAGPPVYYPGSVGRLPAMGLGSSLLVLIASVLVFAFLIRMAILLPAVAVDAPGTIWQNAVADTQGSGWFIACASALAGIPPALLYAAIGLLVRAVMPWPLPALIVVLLSLGAVFFVTLALGVAIASRLYQALGDRLNRPVAAG